jgi:hypothetical protein
MGHLNATIGLVAQGIATTFRTSSWLMAVAKPALSAIPSMIPDSYGALCRWANHTTKEETEQRIETDKRMILTDAPLSG